MALIFFVTILMIATDYTILSFRKSRDKLMQILEDDDFAELARCNHDHVPLQTHKTSSLNICPEEHQLHNTWHLCAPHYVYSYVMRGFLFMASSHSTLFSTMPSSSPSSPPHPPWETEFRPQTTRWWRIHPIGQRNKVKNALPHVSRILFGICRHRISFLHIYPFLR